jgi:chromosome partitioning protein
MKLKEILWQINENLELAPASIDLSAFEQQMAGIDDRENCLREVLNQIGNNYDFIVIDCPPAVGLLTFNAIKAATDVIIPVETGYFSLHGLSKQLETLSILCERSSRQVNVRVLASMYDIRTKMGREILGELRNHFGDKMFKTVVNFNTKIKEAASFGQPICEYDSASKGNMDFRALADEITASGIKHKHFSLVDSLAGQLESISSSADELIKAAKPVIKNIPARSAEPPRRADINAKISDYYGVTQINDTLIFVTLYPRAQKVELAGDFNNWQPENNPMQKIGGNGVWQTKLKLPTGKYRYRLVVDGQWQQDPYNEKSEMNPFGEYNSLAEVQ